MNLFVGDSHEYHGSITEVNQYYKTKGLYNKQCHLKKKN